MKFMTIIVCMSLGLFSSIALAKKMATGAKCNSDGTVTFTQGKITNQEASIVFGLEEPTFKDDTLVRMPDGDVFWDPRTREEITKHCQQVKVKKAKGAKCKSDGTVSFFEANITNQETSILFGLNPPAFEDDVLVTMPDGTAQWDPRARKEIIADCKKKKKKKKKNKRTNQTTSILPTSGPWAGKNISIKVFGCPAAVNEALINQHTGTLANTSTEKFTRPFRPDQLGMIKAHEKGIKKNIYWAKTGSNSWRTVFTPVNLDVSKAYAPVMTWDVSVVSVNKINFTVDISNVIPPVFAKLTGASTKCHVISTNTMIKN